MAYKKQTFVDVVKDEKGNVLVAGTLLKKIHLDHIEDGIAEADTKAENAAYAAVEAKAIAENAAAEATKKELPSVTDTDNGKHLEVENGKWAVKPMPVTSWNDLADKPFGEVVYDERWNFDVTPTVSFEAAGHTFYKISDIALSYDQLLQAQFSLTMNGVVETHTPTPESFIFSSNEVAGFLGDTNLAVGVAYTTGEIETSVGTMNVPEVGTYFGFYQAIPAGTVAAFHYEGVKTLDEKYLPATATLPAVTADDNGKLLQVADGMWAAVEITNGNEVAY